MKRYRKVIICIFILAVSLLAIYYCRPIKLSGIIQKEDNSMLQIIHMSGSKDVSNPEITSEKYTFNSNTKEYDAICQVITDYSYHSSLDTIIKNTYYHGNNDILAIKNDKHTIIITGNCKIMIDGLPYKIGYISERKSKALINKIVTIIERRRSN